MENLLSRMKLQMFKSNNSKNKSINRGNRVMSSRPVSYELKRPAETQEKETQEKQLHVIGQERVLESMQDTEPVKEAEEEMFFDKNEEHSNKMHQEDELLLQIDEFRARAQKLQRFLQNKEVQAMELQQIVEEREDRAEELQQILDEQQERADGITAEVSKQVNGLVRRVDARLDELGNSMDARLEQIGTTMDAKLGRLENTVENKLQEERVASDERVRQSEETLNKICEQIEAFGDVKEQFDSVKTELSEKIHTESVQSYRNTQELLKGIDEKVSRITEMEQGISRLKNMTVIVIVLVIADILGVAGMIALSIMGIF